MTQKKKKKTPHRLLHCIIYLTVLTITGIAAYIVTSIALEKQSRPSVGQETEGAANIPDKLIGTGAQAPEKKKQFINLIYGFDRETGNIDYYILEFWNRSDGSLHYLSIPADTAVTISKELYQRLSVINTELPQMQRLYNLYQYFGKKTAFPYGKLILGDFLNITVDYYTVMTSEQLEARFAVGESGLADGFLTGFKQEIESSVSNGKLEDYLTEFFPHFITDFKLAWRVDEINYYNGLSWDKADFNAMPGKRKNAGFEADQTETDILVRTLLHSGSKE